MAKNPNITTPAEYIDRAVDRVVIDGISVIGQEFVEPDFTNTSLFEEMMHTHPDYRDEGYNVLFDNYIDRVQSLALLAFAEAETDLELNGYIETSGQNIDPYVIGSRVGSFICRRQAMMGVLNIGHWLDQSWGEASRDLGIMLEHGEALSARFTQGFAIDAITASIPGTQQYQSPSELMNWHISETMASFLQKCEAVVTSLEQ